MKFALVNKIKTEATKGARGVCPNCGSEVIAKCGEFRIDHLAHKGNRKCDPWKENETEWHRKWKNKFPNDWQEITLTDEKTGEKHIADIKTDHGLVIEFQHSHIDPEERISREAFYENMVWVVDGTRLKNDYKRFFKGRNGFRQTKKQGFFLVDYPEDCFHPSWVGSKVPVIFDFLGTELIEDPNDLRNNLYCLFPNQNVRESVVAAISREAIILGTNKGNWFKKHKEPQELKIKVSVKNKNVRRKRVSTNYYDPKKGRFVKKRWL